ncbi:hypothetical protein P4O66_018282, partial [Electrophorus voltai]
HEKHTNVAPVTYWRTGSKRHSLLLFHKDREAILQEASGSLWTIEIETLPFWTMTSRRPMTRSYSGNGRCSSQNGEDVPSPRMDSRNYLSNVRPENRSTFCTVMAQLTEETQPCFETTIKSKAVSEACNVKFSCVVTGHPVPELTWYKDDMELDRYCGLPKYEIFRNGKTHTLHIYNCTVDDAAIYQASARNGKGIVSCSGVLEVGTMNEYKIHQRFFAKLKQKAELKRREQEEIRRQEEEKLQEESLSFNQDHSLRKRRFSEGLELNSLSALYGGESEDTQEAIAEEQTALFDEEYNGLSVETHRLSSDLSENKDRLQLNYVHEKAETGGTAQVTNEEVSRKKNRISNGFEDVVTNQPSQVTAEEEDLHKGISLTEYLSKSFQSQTSEEQQKGLAPLQEIKCSDTSTIQEKERDRGKEIEKEWMKTVERKKEQERCQEREQEKVAQLEPEHSVAAVSEAKAPAPREADQADHLQKSAFSSVFHSLKGMLFGKSKKSPETTKKVSDVNGEKEIPLHVPEARPRLPQTQPQEPGVCVVGSQQLVPMEVDELNQRSELSVNGESPQKTPASSHLKTEIVGLNLKNDSNGFTTENISITSGRHPESSRATQLSSQEHGEQQSVSEEGDLEALPEIPSSQLFKCFEKLVKDHITSRLPATLDPLQFPYRPNRSTDDAISAALHRSLAHLENKNNYVRMLFIDFSSAFNTVIPQHLAAGDHTEAGRGEDAVGLPRESADQECTATAYQMTQAREETHATEERDDTADVTHSLEASQTGPNRTDLERDMRFSEAWPSQTVDRAPLLVSSDSENVEEMRVDEASSEHDSYTDEIGAPTAEVAAEENLPKVQEGYSFTKGSDVMMKVAEASVANEKTDTVEVASKSDLSLNDRDQEGDIDFQGVSMLALGVSQQVFPLQDSVVENDLRQNKNSIPALVVGPGESEKEAGTDRDDKEENVSGAENKDHITSTKDMNSIEEKKKNIVEQDEENKLTMPEKVKREEPVSIPRIDALVTEPERVLEPLAQEVACIFRDSELKSEEPGQEQVCGKPILLDAGFVLDNADLKKQAYTIASVSTTHMEDTAKNSANKDRATEILTTMLRKVEVELAHVTSSSSGPGEEKSTLIKEQNMSDKSTGPDVDKVSLHKAEPDADRLQRDKPAMEKLGLTTPVGPTLPPLSPASLRRLMAKNNPNLEGQGSAPAISSDGSEKKGDESGGSTPTSALSCESSPKMKRRDSLTLIPSATPEELASGARRKIYLAKTKSEDEGSDTQSRRDSPYMSPSQARRAAFLQLQSGQQTPPMERRSPLLGRRKATLEVPKSKEEMSEEPNSTTPESKPAEKEKLDPFKGCLITLRLSAPQVIRKIRGEAFSDASGHLKLWCQFFNVLSDSTIKWFRDETEIVEIKRNAGDESQVALAIVQASNRDCGVYGCTIKNEYGSDTTDYLLSTDILAEFFLRDDLEVGEEIEMMPLLFTKGLADSSYWGEKFFGRIMTEEVQLGQGCMHKTSRAKVIYGLDPIFESGSTCIAKVRNPIAYGTKEENNLAEKNLEATKQECKIQNMIREYCKIFAAEARVIENFGFSLEYQGLTDEGSPKILEQFATQHQCNYYCGLLGLRPLKPMDPQQQPKVKTSRSPLLARRPGPGSASPQLQKKGSGSPQLQKKGSGSPQVARKGSSSPKVVKKTGEDEENKATTKHKTVEVPKGVRMR